MKKRNLLLCSLLAALLMLFSGFTPSDGARKLKPAEEKKIERYTIRDMNFMRFSLGKRSQLWERIESGNLPIRYDSLDVPLLPPVSLEMLEANTSDIVVGSFAEDMTIVLNGLDLENINTGVTFSQLHVKHVFKGSLKAGDIIPLCEIFWVGIIDGVETLKTVNAYLPSKSGEDYLFFINRLPETDPYTPNTYNLTHYNGDRRFGRYPILTPEQKARGIENLQPYELSVETVDAEHIRLYNDVAKKYGI